jgi:uridine kinase
VLVRYSDVLGSIQSARPTTLVAVDGLGGAGKSHFAARLAAQPRLTVVHTDHFASWDAGLDWQRLRHQVIDPLLADRPARFQRYDWDERRLAEWHEISPGGVVVLEGVSSYRLSLADAYDLAIWVGAPREVCLARGLERDGQSALPLWQKWMAEEDEYVDREHPESRAGLVVDGAPTLRHDREVEFVALRWSRTTVPGRARPSVDDAHQGQ